MHFKKAFEGQDRYHNQIMKCGVVENDETKNWLGGSGSDFHFVFVHMLLELVTHADSAAMTLFLTYPCHVCYAENPAFNHLL